MNINMLRDSDDDAGFYSAGCGSGVGIWRGANVYRSIDSGASYQSIASLTKASTIGTVTNQLGSFYGGNIPDETNTIIVKMTNGTLSSVTYDGFLNNSQVAIVGDEIISFRTATMDTTDSTIYKLTGLLRGLRGSDYFMDQHVANERFILVDTASLIRIPDSSASFGISRLFKGVTLGGSLATTVSESFTNIGSGLKPYAPVNIGGGRLADGSVVITWVRRNRTNGEWRSLVDVPMTEATESYEIDIYSDNRYATVLRTLTSTSPTVTYSTANQVTDFGSNQSQLYIKVYQMSAVVGRGYAGKGIV